MNSRTGGVQPTHTGGGYWVQASQVEGVPTGGQPAPPPMGDQREEEPQVVGWLVPPLG